MRSSGTVGRTSEPVAAEAAPDRTCRREPVATGAIARQTVGVMARNDIRVGRARARAVVGRAMTRLFVLLCLLVLRLIAALPGRAEDGDRVRYQLGLHGKDTSPATGTHDAWGVSLGANLGRYWGLELSAGTFERFVDDQGRTVFEYGLLAVVP